MLLLIDSWVFVNRDARDSGRKKSSPGPRNRQGWLQTITALLQLSEEMLLKKDYFMTKRCNQGCLENFFNRIRGCGGNRINPSAYELATAFKLASINTLKCKSKFSNCDPDKDRFMFYLLSSAPQSVETEMEVKEKKNEFTDIPDDSLIIDLADEDDNILQETSFEASDFLTKKEIVFFKWMHIQKNYECTQTS